MEDDRDMNYRDIRDQVVYTSTRLWWVKYVIDYLPLGIYTRLKEYVQSYQYVEVPAIECITHAYMGDYSVHSVVVKGVPAFLFVLAGKRISGEGMVEYSNYYPLNLKVCEECVEHLVITCMPQAGPREPIPLREVSEDQDIEDLSTYCGLKVVYGKKTTNK